MAKRTCRKCGRTKPVSEFRRWQGELTKNCISCLDGRSRGYVSTTALHAPLGWDDVKERFSLTPAKERLVARAAKHYRACANRKHEGEAWDGTSADDVISAEVKDPREQVNLLCAMIQMIKLEEEERGNDE